MDKETIIARREAVEGLDAKKLKAAILAASEAAKTGGVTKMQWGIETDDLVFEITSSVGYRGGYHYSGDTWILGKTENLEWAFPRYWFKDAQEPREGATQELRKLLDQAPVGTGLVNEDRTINGDMQRVFEKTTQGWIQTEYYSSQEKRVEEQRLNLFPGIRVQVAKAIGSSTVSTTFHQLFDSIVEELKSGY